MGNCGSACDKKGARSLIRDADVEANEDEENRRQKQLLGRFKLALCEHDEAMKELHKSVHRVHEALQRAGQAYVQLASDTHQVVLLTAVNDAFLGGLSKMKQQGKVGAAAPSIFEEFDEEIYNQRHVKHLEVKTRFQTVMQLRETRQKHVMAYRANEKKLAEMRKKRQKWQMQQDQDLRCHATTTPVGGEIGTLQSCEDEYEASYARLLEAKGQSELAYKRSRSDFHDGMVAFNEEVSRACRSSLASLSMQMFNALAAMALPAQALHEALTASTPGGALVGGQPPAAVARNARGNVRNGAAADVRRKNAELEEENRVFQPAASTPAGQPSTGSQLPAHSVLLYSPRATMATAPLPTAPSPPSPKAGRSHSSSSKLSATGLDEPAVSACVYSEVQRRVTTPTRLRAHYERQRQESLEGGSWPTPEGAPLPQHGA